MSLTSAQYTTVKKDALAEDINAAGRSGMDLLRSGAGDLDKNFYSNPNDYINSQISSENRLMRSASDDATRRTRSLIAARGMGNSSVGLGQEVNQARTLNEKLAMNNASGMDRLKGLLNEKMNTGSQLFNIKQSQGPLQMTDLKYRTPTTSDGKALAGFAGTAIGMYMGGPQGAAAGQKMGESLAS